MKIIIIGVSKGSLVITVECESLMILEELWTDYLSGRLGEVVQNCFVTEKILKELNLAELRLKTTMDIKEYNACKLFFERDTRTDSEDPAPWASAIKAVHDKKRNVRLEEAKSLRENYLQKFSWEEPCNFLVEKMYNLAFDLGARLIVQSSENSDVHQSAVKHTLSILEDMNSFADNNTQSIPLPATETSDMKGGVSVETSGCNSLHCAAMGGNEAIIETLLSSGLDINSRSNDGTTPLMMAAATGQEKTVDLLLSKGADPHLKNFMGRNLLHAAAEGGNSSIVMRALSCDIDINSKDDCSATPLIIAVKQNHIEIVKYLLQKGADISLTTEDKKRNALHIASQEGSVAVIEMLLSYDLRPDSRDGKGNTPLARAAACGHIEAVNCLLKHGADPLLKGQDGRNLLHFAAQSGNVIIIETMLSKGFDIDARDETLGVTPLMVSIASGKLEAAKYLLEKGADKSLKTTPGKLPLLSIASVAGSIAAVEMLLSHGCNIDARDSEGNTPLMHATRLGNTEVVEYLLAQGANPLLRNTSDLGLLHLAAFSDNALTIKAVLSKNLDINASRTVLGITPLLFCLGQGKLEAANYLLAEGADENLKSKDGLTVLSAAAMSGNVAAIEMLLKRGHNPNSRDGRDNTPLMWAAEVGNKAAVEYLLSSCQSFFSNLEKSMEHAWNIFENLITQIKELKNLLKRDLSHVSLMPQEPELQTHHQLKSGSPIPVPDDFYHSHLNVDHAQEQSY
nr:putative ankyrin repeat protein RF_0381 [Pocillopora verrucosa]